MKKYLKQIRKKCNETRNGVQEWFDKFDRNHDNQIDFKEFLNMVHFLEIKIDHRLGMMLYKIFDRNNDHNF